MGHSVHISYGNIQCTSREHVNCVALVVSKSPRKKCTCMHMSVGGSSTPVNGTKHPREAGDTNKLKTTNMKMIISCDGGRFGIGSYLCCASPARCTSSSGTDTTKPTGGLPIGKGVTDPGPGRRSSTLRFDGGGEQRAISCVTHTNVTLPSSIFLAQRRYTEDTHSRHAFGPKVIPKVTLASRIRPEGVTRRCTRDATSVRVNVHKSIQPSNDASSKIHLCGASIPHLRVQLSRHRNLR